MFYPFFFLFTAICTEEEQKQFKDKNKTAITNYEAACDALKSKMKKLTSDFCKGTATEDGKIVVYNALQDVFENSIKELTNRITELNNFNSNFPKDVNDKRSENILMIVNFLEKRLNIEYLNLTVIYNVETSFTKVYCAKLKNLECVPKIDSLKAALDNVNKMFQSIWDTYLNVTHALKAYYEKKIMMLKQKGEEKAQSEKKKLNVSNKDSHIDSHGDIYDDSQKEETCNKKDKKK